MTLYEEILAFSRDVPVEVKEGMSRALVLQIQNVADYYFYGTDQETWSLEESFPNVAPPWPLFWTEYRAPRRLVSTVYGGEARDNPNAGMRTGVLFESRRNGDGWRVMMAIFMQAKPMTEPGALALMEMSVSLEGVPTIAPIIRLIKGEGRPAVEARPEIREFAVELTKVSLHPAFLALSFCHCRNTEVVEVPASRAERRRAGREGRSLLRLHTLEIAPVKAVLDAAKHSEGVSLERALHICRGHFKDYRERGLFGKIKGLFWWDMHIRGNAEAGSVGKDYKVQAP